MVQLRRPLGHRRSGQRCCHPYPCRVRKNVWAWVVTSVIGICVLAIPVWGDLRPGQATPYSYLPWLTLALIAVGIVYMLVLQAVRPQVMGNAAALLEGTR